MSIKHVSVDTPFIYGKKTRNSVKSVICIENIWFPFTVLKICSMTELYGIEFKCRRFIVTQQISITEQQGMQPFKSGGIHPFDPHVDHIQFVLFTKYLNLIVYWECQRSALFIFHNWIFIPDQIQPGIQNSFFNEENVNVFRPDSCKWACWQDYTHIYFVFGVISISSALCKLLLRLSSWLSVSPTQSTLPHSTVITPTHTLCQSCR